MVRLAKQRVTFAVLNLELKKVIPSVLLGLMGWGGAFFAINLSVPPVTLSFLWSYCFPLLAGMAYGAPYGFIAGLFGLGALFPFFNWPIYGWANVVTAGLLLFWFTWQGACAQARAKSPAFWNHAFFAQAVFTGVYLLVMRLGFPAALAANPPFWTPMAIITLPAQVVDSIITQGVLNTFLVVPVVSSLLCLPLLRRWLGLPLTQNSQRVPLFIGISVLAAAGLWLMLILLNSIFGTPGFGGIVFETGSQQQAVSLMALVSMGCLAGYVIARYVEKTRQAERALQVSEDFYRTLINAAPDILTVTDGRGFIRFASSQARQAFSIPGAGVETGSNFLDWVVPEDRDQAAADFRDTVNGKPYPGRHYNLARANGETFIGDVKAILLPGVSGKDVRVIVTIRDITDRKHTEIELRKLSRAVEQSPACIVITDLKGAIEYVNPKFSQLTGYGVNEVIGKNPSILKSDKTPAEIYPGLWETIRSGKEWRGEFCNKKKNGELYWESASISAVLDESGSISHYVAVKIDITERKQRENELEALASISSSLRVKETLAEMLPVILEKMVHLLGGDNASIELIDPPSGDAVVTLTYGETSLWEGYHIPADQGLNSYIRSSGKPYLSNDVHRDPLLLEPCFSKEGKAAAGVPMIAQGQLLGFLWIGRKTEILESDMRPLVAIADIAANAIRRTTLHEQTTQRLKQLSALRQIDSAINENRDLQGTLRVLLEQTLNQLQVDAAMILRLDEATQSLVVEAGLGFQPGSVEIVRLGIDESLAGKAVQERKVLQVTDLLGADAPPQLLGLARAEGFVSYYAAPLIKEGLVKGVIEVYLRKPMQPDPDWLNFLEILAGQAAIAIDNVELFQRMIHSNLRLANAYDATIAGWSAAMDLRDHETEGHTRRVTELSLELAQAVGIPIAEQIHMRRGAMLHDIGKIGVPDRILLKEGRLTDSEWMIMRKHPQYAYDMLAPIEYLRPALTIPFCHHERWDGMGYPRGLKGDQIPLVARVFAVVDVWDALTSNRPYRSAWSGEQALDYIREQAGKHFDPQAVPPFLELLRSHAT